MVARSRKSTHESRPHRRPGETRRLHRRTARGKALVNLENLGWVRGNWTSSRDDLVLDEDPATTELTRFASAGGGCLVDPTVPGIGRDPLALARISRRTGVAIVMGAGYYVAASHPPEIATLTEEKIADAVEPDLTRGGADTGVRAGFIGEIGCAWPLEVDTLLAQGPALVLTGVRPRLRSAPGTGAHP